MLPTFSNKKYDDISFVTMFFQMPMSNLSSVKGHKRENWIEYYAKPLIKLCYLFPNIIVFCDKACYDYLIENMNITEQQIICMDINNLPLYQKLHEYEVACENMKTKFYHSFYWYFLKLRKSISGNPLEDSCIFKLNANPADIAFYTMLNNSKIDVMNMALKYTSSNNLVWVDAGMLQKSYDTAWGAWTGECSKATQKFRGGVRMTSYSRKKIASYRLNEILYGTLPNQVPAGCFMVNRNFLPHFSMFYKNLISDFLAKNKISSEQALFTWILHLYPEFFDICSLTSYDSIVEKVLNADVIPLR